MVVPKGKRVKVDLTTARQVYACGNPHCPTQHYVPSEGPFTGKIWCSNIIFPTKKEDWTTSLKDTCGMPLTRASNDLVTQQNVTLFRVEKQSKQTYIRIPAGQHVNWTSSSQGRPPSVVGDAPDKQHLVLANTCSSYVPNGMPTAAVTGKRSAPERRPTSTVGHLQSSCCGNSRPD